MKTAVILFFIGIQAFAATQPKTLKCNIDYTFKGGDGTVQTEKYSVVGVPKLEAKLGVYSSGEDYTTKDGRFVIRTFGQQMIHHLAIVQSSIMVYDNQSKTGAQAGGMTLGGPATPHNEVIFAYDQTDLSDDPTSHLVNVICDMK
jgi:hypothetical protein